MMEKNMKKEEKIKTRLWKVLGLSESNQYLNTSINDMLRKHGIQPIHRLKPGSKALDSNTYDIKNSKA